ncbi:methyltransferase small [Beutenbergia cavernae DSM 12333]|uniref:Methyltransferase small n=1 Tax=Beutenbergia cavernae (strain ATCC BAA-8 / DSM 12333 / CCUG 43141 / JCM 11478 / NBRC 16432 / NCIMB 13614 / HKI 0122) TaxID=471853 RepID=C5BY06_BEUC1|nr:methyltransferase [Beutenbergia cavernae]ACQ78900.1 methyltransferase small [Beutenbergia cavernae DSM 12333]
MSTPPRVDPDGAAALRADLAPFTVDALTELLGPVAASALRREQAVPARAVAAASDEPAATLLRLFVLGDDVPRPALDAALPRLGTAGAERLGLVTASGNAPDAVVRATCDLTPYAATDAAGDVAWWIASDRGELATGGPLPADYVLGVGGASTTLAQVTVPDRRERVLDLGTGCGIQALHATRHAGGVVATDVSARALAYAAFNAALAGAELDLREGSMLEPVAGERFDLVVSNPPFVITPRTAGVEEYTYRDGGRSGDDVVRDLVTGVGAVLAPGGIAQLLGNWEHRRGEPWQERVEAWLVESGLDGWVVQRELQDPAEYAELWLRDGGTTPDRDPASWAAGYEAWLADFAARGVEGVGFGIVTLHRPTASRASWHRVEEMTGTVAYPLGAAILASVRTADLLAGMDDDGVLGRAWRVARDVTEERYLTPGDADPRVILLRAGGGFGRTVQAGTALAAFVGACDGELTGAQLVGALAALLDAPADALAAELAADVRALARDGLLLPA